MPQTNNTASKELSQASNHNNYSVVSEGSQGQLSNQGEVSYSFLRKGKRVFHEEVSQRSRDQQEKEAIYSNK